MEERARTRISDQSSNMADEVTELGRLCTAREDFPSAATPAVRGSSWCKSARCCGEAEAGWCHRM